MASDKASKEFSDWAKRHKPQNRSYAKERWVAVDPSGRGHWYQYGTVEASSLDEARKLAFPPDGDIPSNYRIALL